MWNFFFGLLILSQGIGFVAAKEVMFNGHALSDEVQTWLALGHLFVGALLLAYELDKRLRPVEVVNNVKVIFRNED